ncbi:MAG: PD40 domain-containing protein [Kiritimatiellae bacterium]|nr:PD40 domain-containing protein [Kiritimatiellia bacterium]
MKYFVILFTLAFSTLIAAPVVTVTKSGAEKTVVTIETAGGVELKAYNSSLSRNLERSGYFKVGPNGQIRIKGAPGSSVEARGAGKSVTSSTSFSDAKGARMAARQFADTIIEAHTKKKGFSTKRIAFVNRKGPDNAELYTCYPDGYDIRQLTSDNCAAVGPRWAPNGQDIYYTGFLQKTPLVYRINMEGKRKLLAQFKGLATGAAVSPDGNNCAIILSYQGNPELYVLNFATGRVKRMTKTPAASEASPCWSPDGTKIAYVSDETRRPQVYIIDVASKKSKRFTTKGKENTSPDWGDDGRLTWTSKSQGQSVIMIADPAAGASSAKVVTPAGSWENPSWAADGRHIIASRDRALFIVDTDPDGDKPVQLFFNKGNWMNPSWSR